MSNATGRNLYIDVPLSNVVVGRRPVGFIADQIIPIVPVTKQSAMYWTTNRKEAFRHEPNISQRAPLAAPRKVTFGVSSDNYFAKNYALAAEWPAEDEVNADIQINLAEGHATNVVDKLMYDLEFRTATLATNVHTTINVATAWTNTAGASVYSNLIDHLDAFRVSTGLKANRIIIPATIWKHVKRNAEIRDILYGDRGGLVAPAQLASLLEVEQILIPELLVNTAGETETDNGSAALSELWGPYVNLMHVNPLRGQQVDTWAQAFRWTDPKLGVPMAVERYPYDGKRKAEGLQVGYYQDEKIVSTDLNWRVASII